jgi:hypothetical protein
MPGVPIRVPAGYVWTSYGSGKYGWRPVTEVLVPPPSYEERLLAAPPGPGSPYTASLTWTPQADSLAVFLNGVLLTAGADRDYVVSDKVITFHQSWAFAPDDDVRAFYSY